MFKRGKGSELSRTAEISKQISACKRFSFERLRLTLYRLYTKTQEKETPKTQKLLEKIESCGGAVSQSLSDAYMAKSGRYVRSTNLLTFNLRTIVLFILLFLPSHLEALYFPFVVFILEPVRIAIIIKYEKLAADLVKRDLFADTEDIK